MFLLLLIPPLSIFLFLIAKCHKNPSRKQVGDVAALPPRSVRFMRVFDCAWVTGNVCLYFLISGYNNNASKKHKFTSINKELWQQEARNNTSTAKIITHALLCMCVCVCACVNVCLGVGNCLTRTNACKAHGSMRHLECCVLCLNCALKSACRERAWQEREPGATTTSPA